ncbi:MAG: chorismate-binding protein [Brevibacterium aurantiacum]|nr:chorismate-binding protein [Brevibacterium aurantiacum]
MRDPLADDRRLDDILSDGLAEALEDWASRTPKLVHEADTALHFDPASAAIKLAQGGVGEQYLVYERAGTWYFAAGPAAEVSVSSDTLHLRVGQWHRSIPVDDPVEAVATALASVHRHGPSRCYGWASFELAFLLYEDRPGAGSDTLIHLMLPEVEVQLDGNAARTRTSIPGMITRITALLRTEPDTSDAISISLEEPDFANYQKKVSMAIAKIKSRALDKVVLSRVVPLPAEPKIDLPQTYLSGRRANTPARSFLIDVGGWKATGFSPETIVEVDPTGRVRTQPLAGTRALHHHRETR